MADSSVGMLFRKRNILGAALIAGIGLGVYLGQFKGFGLGGSGSFGVGSSGNQTESNIGSTDKTQTKELPDSSNDKESSVDSNSLTVPTVVKVLIDDRKFILRTPKEDIEIALPKLVNLIKEAPGDSDGFQVRIYQKETARVSAGENLKDALAAAGVPESAILWVPLPAK